MKPEKPPFKPNTGYRTRLDTGFKLVLVACTACGIAALVMLLTDVLRVGLPWLSWTFISSFPSRLPSQAGILSALLGSFWMLILTAMIALPLGIATAIYFEELAVQNRLNRFIELNIANLAGVPAIIYGMLGLAVFVRAMDLGRSLLAGAMTMSILILPAIIITAREALKAVPWSIREAGLAIGATRWQTVIGHVLPAALPGIMTGVILSLSRAIGEAAPLILLGALAFVAFVPTGPFDAFTVMPVQIYNWAMRPQAEFQELAAAGIIVLLTLLLSTNALAVYIRHKGESKDRKSVV